MWNAVQWNDAIREAETLPTKQSREFLKDILLKLPLVELNRLATGTRSDDAAIKLKRAIDIQNKIEHGSAALAFGVGVTSGAIIPAVVVAGFYAAFKAIQKKKATDSDQKTFPLLFTLKLAEIMELAELFESDDFKHQLLVAFVTFTKRPSESMALRKQTRSAEIWFEDFADRISDIQVRINFLSKVHYQVDFSSKKYNNSDPIYDIIPTLFAVCNSMWEYIITEMQILQADLKPVKNHDGETLYIPSKVKDFYNKKIQYFQNLRDTEYKFWHVYYEFALKLEELKLITDRKCKSFKSKADEVDALMNVTVTTRALVDHEKSIFYEKYQSEYQNFIPLEFFSTMPSS